MSFHFRCPNCNAKLEAEDDWVGLETTCPNCSQTITIRRLDGEEKIPPSPASDAIHMTVSSVSASAESGGTPLKSRKVYLLLGILLGAFGGHDFYAGYTTNGFIKLAISLCTCCTLCIVSSVWAIVDVCNVTEDAEGRPFVD